jgi:hypothetical protein
MQISRIIKGLIEKIEVEEATTADVVGLAEILSTSVSDVTTYNCPYPFGGFHCGVQPIGTPIIITTSQASQIYQIRRIGASLFPHPLDFYMQGTFKALSGRATGLELQVQSLTGNDPNYTLSLLSVLTEALQVDTIGLLYNGCTKTMQRCNDYNNLNNGRHMPYIRGSKNFVAAKELPDN